MYLKLKKLCAIANELDSLGLHDLANTVSAQLQKLAEGPTEEQKKYYQNYQEHRTENKTLDLQKALNVYLTDLGQPPLKHTGVNDQATKSALTYLGIMPGSYNNWRQLFDLVHQKGQQMLNGKNQPASESIETRPVTQTNSSNTNEA